MAKRRAGSEDASPHSKRQKLTENGPEKPKPEDISSARQLQNILAFRQEAGPDTRRNIQAFKTFLESIAHGQDTVLQSSKREILLKYLELQPLSQGVEGSTHTFDLVKTWSFAAQSNNEALFAAVAGVLALLVKTISHHVEFREVGRSICQLLLQNDQLKLTERGLSAQKSKDHLISPCLRLLTEIVSFDGGSLAKRVYRLKSTTFKRLDTFLSLRLDTKSTGSGSRRKPSVRNTALRYLFANLRLQDLAVKTEILANGRILRSVFHEIREDPPSVIHEILDGVRDDILKDERIPRRIKGRIFTDQILGSIATLYNYHLDGNTIQDDGSSQKQENIPVIAHAFLLSICTTPGYGILIEQRGQPSGAEDEELSTPKELDHQNVHTPYKRSFRRTSIKNHTLASFLQTLRPYASDLQRYLVLSTFQAAPELVADYFHRKKTFSFDPKLTATWVGFAALLLSTIQLPLHQQLLSLEEHQLLPPPTSEIIESILPMHLSLKVLSRCLNQNVTVIRFFTIKILSAAFDKFARTLQCFRSTGRNVHSDHGKIWNRAAPALVEEFGQRCPDMNHVITVFRSCTTKDIMLREASARLLPQYYQHLPSIALEQKFDVSVALSTAFDDREPVAELPENIGLESLVLEHLLKIARCSPDIRWWQKADHDKLSLFGSGLRLCATRQAGSAHRSLEALLQSALSEGLSLEFGQAGQYLAGLLKSITKTKTWQPSGTLFNYLDDCFTRLSKKAVKYHQDLLVEIADIQPDNARDVEHLGGELLMAVTEQWPFIQASATKPDLENICRWLSRFLLLLEQKGVDSKLICHVRHRVTTTTADKECRKLLKKAPEENLEDALDDDLRDLATLASSPLKTRTANGIREVQAQNDGWEPPTPPPSENEDHPGLGRWKQMDIEEAIVEGAIGELILCLCSKYADIRKQALIELRSWMKKLQTSQYSEREPSYLLAGELIETVKDIIADTSLPYFAGVAAAEFCLVLSNPLHHMYAKVNKFLNKGPVWRIEKLPSYWVDQILLHLPTNDDAHYKEMGWLLDLLTEGLRTETDIELYRRSHILERLLSLLTSPSLQPSYQEKLLTLLFRCTYVDGSTTLITSSTNLNLQDALKFIASAHISRSPRPKSSQNTIAPVSGDKIACLGRWIPYFTITTIVSPFHTSTLTSTSTLCMAKRYTRAELEYYRHSPLVVKPASLPPAEEWMGALPDPTQKKLPNRGKDDEPQLHDSSNRRPMFERHMSRGSSNVPEDIVLGPPKTAFASAAGARGQSRAFDSPSRSSFGAQGDETIRGDRQNFRDKYSKQGSRYDTDVEGSQESRSGAQQHRKTTNEGESWAGRPSRFPGQDDGERGSRRNGHREQDRNRDTTEPRAPRGFENHRRDIANDTNDTRRNGHGRGRNEPSWYQDEKDSEVFENRREPQRAREWRERNKGVTREVDLDTGRSTKQELDPEWMDEPDLHEKKQAHTQEDFERWKERMKAGNGPAQENAPPTRDQRTGHDRTVSGMNSPAGKPKVETPLVIDSSIDGFFGLWNDPGKRATSTDEGLPSKAEATKIKAPKSSKFTGFFGAKAQPADQEPEVPTDNPFAVPADSSSEDKEGFQRILKLLDQQQTSSVQDGAAREQILRRNMPASPAAQVQQQQDTSNLQSFTSPRSNNGGPVPPNKDSEFLLNLMRQSRPQPSQTNSSDLRQNNPIPPELLPFQNLLVSTPPGLPNLTTREEPKPHDKLNPNTAPSRKGPPPGLFDPQRPGPQDSQRMGKDGPEFAPSFVSQHVPQRQGMMPPPGFQAPLRNPTQFPPGLMANIPPTGPDRGDPYGLRSNPSQAFPPPGFMNPPPPGFPPMPPLNQNSANRMYFGGPPRPPGEGFGEAGDFGIAPGQFRRQD
ncbi:MAG: hypothetical protein Q9225_000182 [Loekoesia sp. 1 TL-2023]